MTILVCGGRRYFNPVHLWATLNALLRHHGPFLLVHGDARGADRNAGEWARWHGIETLVFPAQWHLHGKAAGAIRNRDMYRGSRPDLVVACPGHRGTADMVGVARRGGTPVMFV